MTISLDELEEILEKERKWKDIGGVKENTRIATVIKIIHALAKEPLTKEGIHKHARIHKGKDTLPMALLLALHNRFIFKHQPQHKTISLDNPLETKAYNYHYYLLNWSDTEVKHLFSVAVDHGVGWNDWVGIYYTSSVKHSNIEDKIFGKIFGEDKHRERMERMKNFDKSIFDQINDKAISSVKKQREEFLEDWPGANANAIRDMTKRAVLDTLIHFKIQGMIPNYAYHQNVPFTYVDVWEALEKAGLTDFHQYSEGD